jgi:hypothetical protein
VYFFHSDGPCCPEIVDGSSELIYICQKCRHLAEPESIARARGAAETARASLARQAKVAPSALIPLWPTHGAAIESMLATARTMRPEAAKNPLKVWKEKLELLMKSLNVLDKIDPGLSLQRGKFYTLKCITKFCVNKKNILGIALYEKHLCLVSMANMSFELACAGLDAPTPPAVLALLDGLKAAEADLNEAIACLSPEPPTSPAAAAAAAAQAAAEELNSYLQMVLHLAQQNQ